MNLLLDVLANSSLDADIVRWRILQSAGKSDRIPNPDLYLRIAKHLDLIVFADNEIHLTGLGHRLLNTATWPPFDEFNRSQLELIRPEILGLYELEDAIVSALSATTSTSDGSRVFVLNSKELTELQDLGFRLIQLLRLGCVDPEYLTISKAQLEVILQLLGASAAQTEEELWLSLEATNLRARDAEEYVVLFEMNRLRNAGKAHLSQLVERISSRDIHAGYDVRSFEVSGEPRYIEVKVFR